MVGPRSEAAFLRRKGMTWVHMEGRTGRYQEAVDHGYHVSLELARCDLSGGYPLGATLEN